MRDGVENPTPPAVNIARSHCAAGIFVIHSLNECRAIEVIATDRGPPKACCADSESRFLAIKKFSWSTASRRIAVRQNRFFARIAAPDSQLRFWSARHRKLPKAYDERLVHARASTE